MSEVWHQREIECDGEGCTASEEVESERELEELGWEINENFDEHYCPKCAKGRAEEARAELPPHLPLHPNQLSFGMAGAE